MAELQLIDYIQKARLAGQADEQSRALLYQNGWTDAEVNDAFTTIDQPQPQVMSQPKVDDQPQVVNQLQPQAQYQPQTTPNQMPKEKKGMPLILKIFIFLIILVVLAGAGLFVAGQYFNVNIPWNPFALSPQAVVKNMMANMKNIKAYHTSIQVSISAASSANANQTLGSFSLDTEGGTDITDAKNPKADYTISVNLGLPAAVTSPILANMDVIGVNNVLYLRLNSLQMPTEYTNGINTAQILGNWLEADQDSMKALTAAESSQIGQVTLPPSSASQKMAQEIQNLISSENLVSVDKQLSDQVINGQDTYHYSITISSAKLKDLATKIMNLTTQEAASTQNSGTSAGSSLVDGMAGGVANSFIDAVGDINAEIWIGKKDYLLYQVKFDKTIDLNKLFPGANTQLAIKVDDNNSNFNKPITVQEPASSQKIEDFVLPLIKVQQIQSDMSQVGSTAQMLFTADQSYFSLCTKGLLNGYDTKFGT